MRVGYLVVRLAIFATVECGRLNSRFHVRSTSGSNRGTLTLRYFSKRAGCHLSGAHIVVGLVTAKLCHLGLAGDQFATRIRSITMA